MRNPFSFFKSKPTINNIIPAATTIQFEPTKQTSKPNIEISDSIKKHMESIIDKYYVGAPITLKDAKEKKYLGTAELFKKTIVIEYITKEENSDFLKFLFKYSFFANLRNTVAPIYLIQDYKKNPTLEKANYIVEVCLTNKSDGSVGGSNNKNPNVKLEDDPNHHEAFELNFNTKPTAIKLFNDYVRKKKEYEKNSISRQRSTDSTPSSRYARRNAITQSNIGDTGFSHPLAALHTTTEDDFLTTFSPQGTSITQEQYTSRFNPNSNILFPLPDREMFDGILSNTIPYLLCINFLGKLLYYTSDDIDNTKERINLSPLHLQEIEDTIEIFKTINHKRGFTIDVDYLSDNK